MFLRQMRMLVMLVSFRQKSNVNIELIIKDVGEKQKLSFYKEFKNLFVNKQNKCAGILIIIRDMAASRCADVRNYGGNATMRPLIIQNSGG